MKDGRMDGQKVRSGRMGKSGRYDGSGREDMTGLPEHERCPREVSYKRS